MKEMWLFALVAGALVGGLALFFWESEEKMGATEQDADQLRSAWAESSGQQIASVESYEVGFFEVDV